MKPTPRTSALMIALLAGASLLAACDRTPDPTVGQRAGDTALTSADRRADNAGADIRQAGRDAGSAVGNAAQAVVDTSRDISITAAVNAKLAADERLSALGINVDTNSGHVVLRGSAPDTESRNRATELARSVDGVSAVDNELNVQAR